jgi:hypothetical protein
LAALVAIAFGLITTLITLQDARAGGDPGYLTDAFALLADNTNATVGPPEIVRCKRISRTRSGQVGRCNACGARLSRPLVTHQRKPLPQISAAATSSCSAPPSIRRRAIWAV